MVVWDLIIIGAGPAGMTAAIYAKRKGLSFIIIGDNTGGQMSKTGIVENYPGYMNINGPQLAANMTDHMDMLKVEFRRDRAHNIEPATKGFIVHTAAGHSYETLSIIVASGSHWRELGVPGEDEYKNKGVSYCTTCDAPLFQDMDVAVIGGGNSAASAVLDLANVAKKIYMVVRSSIKADQVMVDKINALSKVSVLQGYVVEKLTGTDFIEKIYIKNSKTGEQKILSVGGVFVEIGLEPNTGFIKGMIALNDKGEIKVDPFSKTSTKGIFAAGDVTDVPQKQIVVAAGEGAKAAMSAYNYINTIK